MADAEYSRQHAAAQFDSSVVGLKRYFDNEDYDKALPLCMKALDAQPDNATVQRCRVFALLNLSRWGDVLQCCEKYKSGEDAFTFERAYCLYRLNKFQEALDTLGTAEGDEDCDRIKRLEAQVRYRMGDYNTCAGIYEGIYEEAPDDNDALVCAMASHISGEKARNAISLTKNAAEHLENSYEVCFNIACAYIDEDRLAEAESKLHDAKNLCMQELEGDLDDDEDAAKLEDHEELAAIHVQRGCMLQRRDGPGDLEEATELYNRVLRQRTGTTGEVDVTVLAVACNNVVALRSEGKSLFDSLKRINVASKESLEHKLTTKQTVEIAMNKCLLLLQARKLDDAKRELQRLGEAHPGHPRVAILEAVIASKDKKAMGSPEEVLQSYLAKHPGSEEVLLCLAHIHEQHSRSKNAAEALTQLPAESRAQPKTVEAIVALHLRQKRPEKAVACLREAIEFWNSQEDVEETFGAVLRTASRVAAQVNDRAFAAEVFQAYLEKVDGSDNDALCGLVQALASTDIEKAEEYAERLQVPEYGHLDPEELEASPIPKVQKFKQAAHAVMAAQAISQAPAEDGSTKSKVAVGREPNMVGKTATKKRKTKIRYPKGFDPENPGPLPDPERWLPKHERAEYKKKMNKKNKGLMRGPQGAITTDDNAFRNKGPSTAQVDVAKDTTTGRSRAQQGRKKGKK